MLCTLSFKFILRELCSSKCVSFSDLQNLTISFSRIVESEFAAEGVYLLDQPGATHSNSRFMILVKPMIKLCKIDIQSL